jgi:dTDP-glucose 4,6-dehydratase
MRVLVAGAAGFLGSNLVDRLLADGHVVLGVDNLCTGTRENLAHLDAEPRFRLIEHDICLPLSDQQLGPEPFDSIYNLASPASPPEYMRLAIETLRVGSVGTENMLRLAERYGAGFLQASTSECYGDPGVHPQPESYWGNVNPVGPRSMYDEAKRFAEALTMAYHRMRGVNTHLARIFNTYGPRLHPSDGRVISNFMVQALCGEPLTIYGDGSQTRSFCYVDDLIEGFVRLAASDEYMPVNIGNPAEFTILECAQAVLEVTGSSSSLVFSELPEDDPTRRQPDIARARELLGWEPKVELREGLRRSLGFFERKAKYL